MNDDLVTDLKELKRRWQLEISEYEILKQLSVGLQNFTKAQEYRQLQKITNYKLQELDEIIDRIRNEKYN